MKKREMKNQVDRSNIYGRKKSVTDNREGCKWKADLLHLGTFATDRMVYWHSVYGILRRFEYMSRTCIFFRVGRF